MHHRTSTPAPVGAVTAHAARGARRPGAAAALAALLLSLLVTTLTVGGAPAQAVPQRAPTEEAPLRLTLEEVSPAVLRDDSDVTLTGTLTNDSDETWTTVNVLAFRSAQPITDAAQLAEAAVTPVEDYVGARVTDPGTFQTIPSIDPGESVPFTAYLPRESLATELGVYWIGVHALGQSETILRDDLADGRARTFLPIVEEQQRPVPASIVLPLRATVRHRADGSLANPAGWAQRLGAGGRLNNLLEIGEQAGDSPMTWLVDPAVLHAVERLAAGNPGTSLRPAAPADPDDPDSGDPGASPPEEGLGSTPDPDAGLGPEPPSPDEEAAAAAAVAWMASFREVTAGHPILALPYGDVDVSALAEAESPLLDAALQRSAQVMAALNIEAQPALSSPDGFLSPEALRRTPPDSLVLLSDRAVEGAGSGRLLGHPFVTVSSGVAQGGPGPEPAGSRIAVRQRLMSEAALRLLSEDRSPLVVVPPSTWDPAASADLAEVREERLVRWRPLSAATAPQDETLPEEALQLEDQPFRLPSANVRAAESLVEAATLLDGVLAEPAGLAVQSTDVALADLSYFARRDPARIRSRTIRNYDTLTGLLRSIRVDDNLRAVTLSGDSGAFGVTLLNPLDVPVVVSVRARAGDSLTLGPVEPVRLAPQSRRRLLLNASVARQGVHTLGLQVTDAEGVPLGPSTTISVRAAQVSGLLWFIMAGGVVMLFGAIGVRLFRRVRAARRTGQEPADQADPADPADPVGPPSPVEPADQARQDT